MCWVLGLIGHPTRTAAWLCGLRATTCFAQGLVAFMNVLGFSGLGGSEGLVQGFRVETAITASRFQVYSVWRFGSFGIQDFACQWDTNAAAFAGLMFIVRVCNRVTQLCQDRTASRTSSISCSSSILFPAAGPNLVGVAASIQSGHTLRDFFSTMWLYE